ARSPIHEGHRHYFFPFAAPATTGIYILSLHDALPISPFGVGIRFLTPMNDPKAPRPSRQPLLDALGQMCTDGRQTAAAMGVALRSEEHTSELQSRGHLVCRLLLEKKT